MNEKEFFDWDISKPYLILMGLGLLGGVAGIFKLVWSLDADVNTIVLNLLWTVYNLIMLGAAIAVANEARQVRLSQRVSMSLQAAIRTADGKSFVCETTDYSDGGVGIKLASPLQLPVGEKVCLTLQRGLDEYEFDAAVTLSRGLHMGLQFAPMTTQQSVDFVQCTFARADSWVVWGDKRKPDKPFVSMLQVSWLGLRGFKVLTQLLLSEIKRRRLAVQSAGKSTQSVRKKPV